MPNPSDFGINLNSTHYQSGNKFVTSLNDANFLWCTEFAFGRGLEKGLISNWTGTGGKINGHAGQWDDQAGSWNRQAKANSFVVWDPNQGGAGSYGHVGFVERVNSDGSFTISEANWGSAKGVFTSRTISPGSNAFNSAKFVHLGTSSTPSGSPTTGSDRLYGGSGNDNIDALAGNDTVTGAGGSDKLNGNSGNDRLYGEDGNDTLTGWTGNDYLSGGSGNDILDGFYYSGTGGNGERDTLSGGSGSDTFVIGDWYGKGYLGSSWAMIEDFRDGDKIKVQGSLSQYSLKPGNWYGYSSSDTAIVLRNNTSEVLAIAQNAAGSLELSSSDFIAA